MFPFLLSSLFCFRYIKTFDLQSNLSSQGDYLSSFTLGHTYPPFRLFVGLEIKLKGCRGPCRPAPPFSLPHQVFS